MTWVFEASRSMGGAAGEAYTNVLVGTGLNPASVLAREAIQNSVDAVEPSLNGKARVVFRRVDLTGIEKSRFIDSMRLPSDFRDRCPLLGLQPGNFYDACTSVAVPLGLLYIEDYGTHGLFGDPHVPESHFHRLLFSLGDGSKARGDSATGGSFGYGKSVYSANSQVHTIFAHTVVDADRYGGGCRERLMGCSYFPSHVFNDRHYTGRAWLGDPDRRLEDGGVFPYEGGDAHEMASEMGFSRRSLSDTGTSVLIIDCMVNIDQLRQSIEEWWWPRILENDLDVELWHGDTRVAPPRPRSREDLRPFIHCFEMATKLTPPAGRHDKADEFNRLNGKGLGSYGFTLLNVESEVVQGEGEIRGNHIALIRSPRMVVAYRQMSRIPVPCAGAFVASEDADHALRMSESPSHDKWDIESTRLDETGREIVRRIDERLRREFSKFARAAVPPPQKGEMRLDALERMLGAMFRPPTGPGRRKGGSEADPIQINFAGNPQVSIDKRGLRTVGEFWLSLARDADEDETLVSVEVVCVPVEDDGSAIEDPIGVYLTPSEGVECAAIDDSDSRLLVALDRDSRPRFSFSSHPYPPDWTTRVSVLVKEIV